MDNDNDEQLSEKNGTSRELIEKTKSWEVFWSSFVRVAVAVFLCIIVHILVSGATGESTFANGGSSQADGSCTTPLNTRLLRVGIPKASTGGWAGFAGGVISNGGLYSPTIAPSRWINPGVEFVALDGFEARENALKGCAGENQRVDVLWSSVESWAAEFPMMQKHDVHARTIMQIARARNACSIIAQSRIRSPQKILPHSLVISRFSPAHWLAQEYFDKSLHDRDPILPVKSDKEALDDFLDKSADAIAICDPYVHDAMQRSGAHKLLDLDDQGTDYILIARESTIAESKKYRPNRLKDLIEVWLDGNQESQSNPDFAAQLLLGSSELYSESKEEFETQREHVQLANMPDNMMQFGLDGENSRFDERFRLANQEWHLWGLVDLVPPDKAKDDRLLREIYQSSSVRPAREQLCAANAGARVQYRATVHFDPQGSAELLQKYTNRDHRAYDDSLTRAAMLLNTPPGTGAMTQICIVGYTDDTGTETQNSSLSLRRARAVADFLHKMSVGRDRMITTGKGKRDPIASNLTDEGQLMNRRVEITVVEGTIDQ